MVLKFLGIGKKKSEYFLEAPPADTNAADTKPAAKEQHVEPVEPAQPAADAAAATGKKEKKTLREANAEKKAKAEAQSAPSNGKAPAKPEVKAAPASTPEVKADPMLTNFATNFQVSNTPRRRPGPSLNGFKDMAKQVNTRR
jgi:hypothetical protein